MKSNTELLSIAKAQLGNTGGKYRSYVGEGGSWCDMFVFWLFDANGCGSLVPWVQTRTKKERTYCPDSIKWCQKNLAELPPYLAMACDIMYFDWDKNKVPNHIGIVESRVNTAAIKTIEGNTSGGIVDDKKRETKYNCGIFRPHFVPTGLKVERLEEDGEFEYKSIYMLQTALKITQDGILGRGTLAELQRRAGLTGTQVDSAWGPTTSRAVQKLVGLTGKDIDGQWGKQSTLALQWWVNKECGYTGGVLMPEPVQQTYTGALPDLVAHSGQIIAYTAKDLSWAKGTKKSKLTYPGGKAKAAFMAAINKVFPKRSSWSKQCQAGASCDVGAATVIRFSGIDTKVPRGLQEQIPHFKKSSLWKKTGLNQCSVPGDVGMNSSPGAHIWIYIGNGLVAEASHTNKLFERITKNNRDIKGRNNGAIYRASKASVIRTGDRGTEVTKLQNFLNWAGFDCGKADGEFGDNTDKAVKAFQTKVGIEADGEVYTGTLAKMKEYTK